MHARVPSLCNGASFRCLLSMTNRGPRKLTSCSRTKLLVTRSRRRSICLPVRGLHRRRRSSRHMYLQGSGGRLESTCRIPRISTRRHPMEPPSFPHSLQSSASALTSMRSPCPHASATSSPSSSNSPAKASTRDDEPAALWAEDELAPPSCIPPFLPSLLGAAAKLDTAAGR